MRAIFISYRRDDAAGEAGRLFDDLTAQFGPDKVFMDVAGIEPGHDFRKVIDQNVASCGVLLAMIGKGWVDAKDDAGRRRLDDPLDFVRLETASALKRDIPVIPVLVRGGRMPRAEQLPEDLTDLAYRNGVELTHTRWRSDVELLIKALRSHVGNAEKESGGVNQAAVAVPETSRRSPFWGRALIGIAVAIVVASAVWYQYFFNVFAISRVDTTEPFVANGKLYDVIVEFKARNNPVQNVEVHFVRGDTTWKTNSWTAKVSTDENNLGRVSVGAMSYRSTKPASATFLYVLIAADGKRSQPYEKTFKIAPGSFRLPSITTIIVPNAIHVGQTFSFNLAYNAPDADIVQIQRRVLESSIEWPQEQTTLNVSGAVGHRSGSVSSAFPASQAPYKATAEFVLVDAQGNRSEPRRMSFEVLPATATAQTADRMRNNPQIGYRDANSNVFCANCATVIGVREVAQEGEATVAGAIAGGLLGGVLRDQVGHGRGNDAATAAVAGALTGHHAKSYEITVRYNDGHAEVIRQSTAPQWRNGDRVQIVNGVLRYAP